MPGLIARIAASLQGAAQDEIDEADEVDGLNEQIEHARLTLARLLQTRRELLEERLRAFGASGARANRDAPDGARGDNSEGGRDGCD